MASCEGNRAFLSFHEIVLAIERRRRRHENVQEDRQRDVLALELARMDGLDLTPATLLRAGVGERSVEQLRPALPLGPLTRLARSARPMQTSEVISRTPFNPRSLRCDACMRYGRTSPAFHFASGKMSGTSPLLWVQGSTVQSSLLLRSLITAVLCGGNRATGAAIVWCFSNLS
jgi:hypothetical protein